jgi:Uncharacterized proteins, homologs of lactam utilization protein B
MVAQPEHAEHARGAIDLNADVGEGGAFDAELFASGISSANVACGAHAGDRATMAAACALAVRHGVALGAHPGYADREGFGRREQTLTREAASRLLDEQLDALGREAARTGASVRHVKPHGALYHQADRESWLASLVVSVARRHWPSVRIFGPPGGALEEAARQAGAVFVAEGFIDRAYRPDGRLVARGDPGAVLHEESAAVAQALTLAGAGRVRTLCVHGDGPAALRLLRAARAALLGAGFRIEAPGD